jgi:outer membrane lipoprotein carrier protein
VSGARAGGLARLLFPSLLLLALAASPARAAAEPPKLDELLRVVDGAKASIETLAGEFTQRNRVKLFKQELTSKGRLYFRRPRQIRWEYTAPDPSTLILDGNRATLRTPGAAPQLFDLERDATMRAVFEQLLTWLGPGSLAAARADYELAAGGTASAPTLLLTPRADRPVARAFSRVELRLDGKSGLLRAIALTEKNGDEKEISFTKMQKNVALPTDAFR